MNSVFRSNKNHDFLLTLRNTVTIFFFNGDLSRLLAGTILIFVLMSVLNPEKFLTFRNFVSMSYQFPELGIFSLAIMISLITGGIDLSVISIANLSGILAAFLLTAVTASNASLWIGTSVLIIIATSALCGILNGILIAYLGITPILATLGTMQLYMGISFVMTKGTAVAGYPEPFLFIGNGTIASVPIPLVLFLSFILILHIVYTRTRFGVQLFMTGTNPTAAWFSGIDTRTLIVKTYTLSGMLSGIAGLIMIARTNSAKADYGSSYLLQAVLVAILAGVNPRGGYGNVWGVVLAVVALQLLSSGLNMLMFHEFFRGFINNFTKEFTWGILLLLVMVINTYSQRRESPMK